MKPISQAIRTPRKPRSALQGRRNLALRLFLLAILLVTALRFLFLAFTCRTLVGALSLGLLDECGDGAGPEDGVQSGGEEALLGNGALEHDIGDAPSQEGEVRDDATADCGPGSSALAGGGGAGGGQSCAPSGDHSLAGEGDASTTHKGRRPRPPPRFILYRVLGNDMPPLQSVGQLRWNLEYVLRHESHFPKCRKRWVLNRIANATEKALIVELLRKHHYRGPAVVDIPFDAAALARRAPAAAGRAIVLNPILDRIKTPEEELQRFGRLIRDYMELNNGRNAAIADGLRAGARWILCYDANQFLPRFSWRRIRAAAAWADRRPAVRYIETPMVRLRRKQQPSWLHKDMGMRAVVRASEGRMEEGQLTFRNDSTERFNENMAYSLAPKQDLLDRTCHFKSTTCACHDTEWWWRINTPKAMAARMTKCGVSIRLWNFPEKEARSIRLGDGNARRDMRIKSARRYVEYVQRLVEEERRKMREEEGGGGGGRRRQLAAAGR